MKKYLMLLVMLVLACVILTACGDNGSAPEHVHTCLAVEGADATCTAPMICNRCSVTEGTRLSAHRLEYNADYGLTVCTCCNSVLLDDTYLQFTPSDDGNSYWITGTTHNYSFLDGNRWSGIILPDAYEGKPVTAVMVDDYVGLGIQVFYTNLFIPKTVELIGSKYGSAVFESDHRLERVFFESGINLKVIGDNAFGYANYLVSIEFPEGLVEIGDYAFNSRKMKDVAFPSTLERIGVNAFAACPITSVILPDNLKWIGIGAFNGCTSLVNVILPENAYIEGEIFDSCNNIQYTAEKDGLKYIGSASNPYLYLLSADSDVTDAVVASGCVYIGNEAFYGHSQLRSVTLPDGVRIVFRNAFNECSELRWLIVPDSLEDYGQYAFGVSDNIVIYFTGSYEQWKMIGHTTSFHGDVHCYSETYKEPVAGVGAHKYWHYDENGNPTLWEQE